ncbi:PAS domain-containing sensor histidine kinase [candidate division WWE3 bacterium]|nr:PAS domain-containing sensor histidine kinase [candidate division WWE3 bacterium]
MLPSINSSNQPLIEIEKTKLRNVISSIKEGVIVVDTKQNVSIINDAAGRLTGFGTTNVIGTPISETLKIIENEQSVPTDTFCPTITVDIDGVVYQKTNIGLQDKGGQIKPINITSRRIKGGESIDVGCIIILEDLFQKADLDRTKLDFTAMAGHTLRTPLSEIKGYLSFLEKETTKQKLDTNEQSFLDGAVKSVNDLVSIVENLLELGQIQSGGYEMKLVPMDLDKAVELVLVKLRPQAYAKKLKVIYAPSPIKLPNVMGDATRIKIVLENLIDNAIKFTETGYIKILLIREKDTVTVSIEDSGKGIPRENIKFLFERFYRVKKALDMENGVGLGLYLSKKIIDQHNGKIWLESSLEHGTKVFFSLPLATNDYNMDGTHL